jgi:hypothetical protein
MEASQDPNMENMEWPGKWHHFTMKSDSAPVWPLPAGGAATPATS